MWSAPYPPDCQAMFSPYDVQPGNPCRDRSPARFGLCVRVRYRARWHDQRCATSVVPATSESRRMPREARALLMSRTRRWSNPDTAGEETATSVTGVDAGAVAIKGAPAAAETSSARRRRGGARKGDIWDFLLAGQNGLSGGR